MNISKLVVFFAVTICFVNAFNIPDAKGISADKLADASKSLSSNSAPQTEMLAQALPSLKKPSQEQIDRLTENLKSFNMASKEIEQVTQAFRSGQLAPALRKLIVLPEDASEIETAVRPEAHAGGPPLDLFALILIILKIFGLGGL